MRDMDLGQLWIQASIHLDFRGMLQYFAKIHDGKDPV